jgi:hypothetical protein
MYRNLNGELKEVRNSGLTGEKEGARLAPRIEHHTPAEGGTSRPRNPPYTRPKVVQTTPRGSVDGKEVAQTTVKRTVPAAFTGSETLDVGVDLGSPVALAYHERAPFKFDGKIAEVSVNLK